MKIVNKIVTFLGAAAVFPVFLTQMLFSIILSIDKSSLVYSGLNLILGKDNQITGSRLGIEKTAIDIFDYFTGKTTSSFDLNAVLKNLPADVLALKKFVIASIVFAAIGLFITVIVMGTTLFTKAYKTVIGLSLGGAASFLVSIILFGKAAAPFLDGTVDVAGVISPLFIGGESVLGALASSALTGSVKVDACGLGGAVYGAMFVLFGVAIWELAFYITLPKEERKASKKMKA